MGLVGFDGVARCCAGLRGVVVDGGDVVRMFGGVTRLSWLVWAFVWLCVTGAMAEGVGGIG